MPESSRQGIECTKDAASVLDQVSEATKIPKIHLASQAIELFLPVKYQKELRELRAKSPRGGSSGK